MRSRLARLCAAVAVLAASAAAGPAGAARDAASWVDPFIGTWPPGFVNPGPQLPHGMVAAGPDTEGPLNYGGYYKHNATITGFSHTHMSAGVPQGGQLPLMPVTGPVARGDVQDAWWTQPVPAYASPADDGTEVAEPGYYAATLARYATHAELTATTRTALHRYTFPPGIDAGVVVHAGRDLKGARDATIRRPDAHTLTGSIQVTGPDHPLFYAVRFERAPASVAALGGAALDVGDALSARGAGVVARFGDGGGAVHVKAAISYVDEAGALGNLAAESPGWDFGAVRAAARAAWNTALERIEVTGGTPAERISFATALYHAQLFPNIVSDTDGRYRGGDGAVRTGTRPHYSQFSLWDSYRGQNQLLAVIDPDAYRDMMASLLDYHRATGALPRWQLAHQNPGYMSGDPAIPFIAEGWCRGLTDPATEDELYDAMASLVARRPASYASLGYLPVRPPRDAAELVEGGPREAGTTLEYGVADFALALVAGADGRTADRDALVASSRGYAKLLDPQTRWIRPRQADGTWVEPFLPELGYGFQEGTSWQYSWLAMHDLAGLVDGMGGAAAVRDRLDAFFAFPASATVPVLAPKAQNQATAFGIAYYGNQYAPGNEHDLEAPFVYTYAGAPWRTQAVARAAASIYTPTIDGLPGNDDLGALSGWLVWTMLGIYPITPGAPLYMIASPHFERAVIHAGGGDIVVEAPGASAASKFVVDARLGETEIERAWVTESELLAAPLSLTTSPIPDPGWAAAPAASPPSSSTHSLTAFGCTP